MNYLFANFELIKQFAFETALYLRDPHGIMMEIWRAVHTASVQTPALCESERGKCEIEFAGTIIEMHEQFA